LVFLDFGCRNLNKLVIFGVGLIGGSVALALKRAAAAPHVVGIGRSGESLQAALGLGVIDAAETDAKPALTDADMVIIAAPVAQTAAILAAITPHLSSRTVVTDVGSTKTDVIHNAQAILGDKISQFVPGHPIAGAEKSGVTAARADLFDGKNIVLTPTDATDRQALEKVRKLWETTGARVSEMTASNHDNIFAAVSHLPHLLAFALVDEIASRPNATQLFDFAASGFRDFTRIAGSSPEMWRDISLANREALLNELAAYQDELAALSKLLQNNDGAGLQALFERASHARNNWAHAHPTNKQK
jgi:prephenate dehydrogenase